MAHPNKPPLLLSASTLKEYEKEIKESAKKASHIPDKIEMVPCPYWKAVDAILRREDEGPNLEPLPTISPKNTPKKNNKTKK